MKNLNPLTVKSILWPVMLFNLLFLSGRLFSANDKYRIIIINNPATTITIGWNQISGDNPIVYYDVTDHGTDYTQYAFQKDVDRVAEYKNMNNHFARLTGLTPNTAYYFVIHDSEGTSQRYWFKTAPNDTSRLSIIAGGDSRTNREPRQRANLLVSKLKPHVVLFGGDMTEDNTSTQWKEWLDDWQYTTSADGRMIPVIPAMGNHESQEVIYYLFDTPDNKYYYANTFGDNIIRIYTLNTEVSVSGNQLTWLKNDLNANTQTKWKMAQYHKPMRPHYASKPNNDAAYDAWAHLFYNNNVRLVVECDAHTVKETWPVEPSDLPGNDEGFIRNNTYGCVYVGEGGWGAPLRNNNNDKTWTRNSGKFYQFKLIFIDQNKIEVRTVKTDNADEVGEVSNDDPFTLPENIDIWNPSNGPVVEITPAPPMNKPDIYFPENTQTVYVNGDNITLEVEVANEGNGIDSVVFYVNGQAESTVTSQPYTFTRSYADGQYFVKAVAFDQTGLTDKETLSINVGIFTETVEVPIKNGQDDIEETQAGLVYFNSSDLEMMFDDYEFDHGTPNGFQKIGLRFQKVFIPKGAVIDSAFIQFRSDETDNQFAEFLLFSEKAGSAAPFDDDSLNVSSREMNNDSVYWAPPAWNETGVTGPAQKTPDIKTLLQAVIDGEEWASGNNVVIKITGTGVSLTNEDAIRVADSYEGKPTNPATLIYTYHFDAAYVGVDQKNHNPNLLINAYPNPFDNSVKILFKGNHNQNYYIKFSDVTGRVVYRQKIMPYGNELVINPNITVQGIYILTVYSETNNQVFSKILVRR